MSPARGRTSSAFTVLAAAVFAVGLVATIAAGADDVDPLGWPAITRESRPWTRWWWLGSAVDRPNLTRLLEQYRTAGLGGVEICPIYGAKGYEDRYLPFLSPPWMEMLAHTTAEARRLGLGVDLTTGTGWPFGGPGVTSTSASSRVVLKAYEVAGGGRLEERLPAGIVQCLRAVPTRGRLEPIDLTDRVRDGHLDWTAPPGSWRLYAVVQAGPVQKVKRAAPGGEGNVLDPYSVAALEGYVAGFDRALRDFPGPPPRAHFHDSFEYFGANWTAALFVEFARRRGYDLREHLPAFFGEGNPEEVARIKDDYRSTIADLHMDYIARWTSWAHAQQGLARDQAHGAPANLLDLYASVDIPETEIFRRPEEGQIPFLKLASSAAHVRGRPLTSAESFTWLGEHFQVPLSEVKTAADLLFLAGINHIFFHGTPYSPQDVAWPGWLFYASVNFGPQGGLWRDLPAFNAYATRCQSILQAGRPANDVLLYFPIHDLWQVPEGQLIPLVANGRWLQPLPYYAAATTLWERGYGYDGVSDRLLAEAKAIEGGQGIELGGNTYRALVVPRVRVMPAETLQKLAELAQSGATVIFQGNLPDNVPGYHGFEDRRTRLRAFARQVELLIPQGKVRKGDDPVRLLEDAGVVREPLVDAGLRFVRRSHSRGFHYFLVHRGATPIDGWITLGTPATSAVLLDPRREDSGGLAALRHGGEGQAQVFLQMLPGESRILRTFTDGPRIAGRPWPYLERAGEPRELTGTWKVAFVDGGPVLPAPYETDALDSWTEQGGPDAARFAGTARYSLSFVRPGGDANADWRLDLGRVAETARVRLNGRDVATLWAPPMHVALGPALRPGQNLLEVEVTNLAANRIADLDRRGVNWKSFHEINFVNIDYKPFDASGWPPRDSGLLGPVRLIPLRTRDVISREIPQ
jgi:hypothetical protein